MDRPNKDLHEPADKSMVIVSTRAGPRERRKDAAATRREFLGIAMATSLLASTRGSLWAAHETSGVPCRALGRTGETVSIVGLGGYHIGA